MRSSKSRSRSKANRPRPLGNVVNRVFDSSGPEGKVRGTPQQIIDKYLVLARDAQLGNDRVAAENFLQHAEHYTRMLTEAQRETAREAEVRRQSFGGPDQPRPRGDEREPRRNDGAGQYDAPARDDDPAPEPAAQNPDEERSSPVETPEGGSGGGGGRRRKPAPQPAPPAAEEAAAPQPAEDKPAPKRRAPRRPRTSGGDAGGSETKTSAAE